MKTPARKHAPKPMIAAKVQDDFRELVQVIQAFKNPAVPTNEEREYLWLRAFELFDEKVLAGAPAKSTRLALRKFLIRNASFLAVGASALRVAFKRKYDRWCRNERHAAGLKDGRKGNSRQSSRAGIKPG